MIEFRDVSKRYGSIRALDSVSFAVQPGDVFGYIGPNGAGKTTSIRILTGLVRDYDGAVLVDGTPIEAQRESFHTRVGYLPQTAGFQEWRTVRHALETFGRLSGLDRKRLAERIAEVTVRLGLAEHIDRRIVHLSGGMQQRLRFAQAILHEPDIVILDEPLSGLDPSSRAELKQTIRDLSARGSTILFSSHVLSDVEDLASRIVILDRGTIRAAGTQEELRARYRVGAAIEVVLARSGSAAGPADGRVSTGPPSGEDGHDASGLCSLADQDTVERVDAFSDRRGDGAVLHLRAGVDEDAAMHRVLNHLVRQNVPVRAVRQLQPTLEDVYLSLTEASRE